MEAIIILYILINIYGFYIMYADKQRAKQHKWRVSEKHIWLVAVVGGALGATLGMKQFRHKTKHKQFAILLPILSVLTITLYIYILSNMS
ncbi:DUF1294 domain-containing protein [Fredinandcohnia sp. 179-A 10B2 NHS]|uniref:DUF1294 domain-containing protein n=1 Tax=Fredinandcohnia sp. 179-A 10B2 NHS TaxID=3235176 RepID=UPI0039A100E9